MAGDPELELADGSLSFTEEDAVLLVDPTPMLLIDVIDAWTTAAPGIGAQSVADLEALGDGEPHLHEKPPRVPELEVLARETVLDAALAEFHTASRVAAFESVGILRLRTTSSPYPNTLLIGGDRVAAIVGDSVRYAIEDTDPSVTRAVRAELESAITAADGYAVRTPTREQLYTAFADRLTETAAADVVRLFDASAEIYRDDPCNHLVRPYLVGARHGVQHYDLRRAGEEAGLASQATFSRIKSALVEDGVLETERVPREVGRPRQRVVFADDRFEDAELAHYPALVEEIR